MADSKKHRRSTVPSSHDASDDFSIYPHRDHVRSDELAFRLGNYGDAGVFTEEEISNLSCTHDLSFEHVRELSRLLGCALDKDTHANLVKISRSVVLRRLGSTRIRDSGSVVLIDANEANSLFRSLGLSVRVADELTTETATAKSTAGQAGSEGSPALIGLETASRVLRPDDKRRERDSRRLLVVESCCYIALDAGWNITYTTDSTLEKDQRGGRLIALIKDVVSQVTGSNLNVSGHTLKSDIELVRRRFENRGDL